MMNSILMGFWFTLCGWVESTDSSSYMTVGVCKQNFHIHFLFKWQQLSVQAAWPIYQAPYQIQLQPKIPDLMTPEKYIPMQS